MTVSSRRPERATTTRPFPSDASPLLFPALGRPLRRRRASGHRSHVCALRRLGLRSVAVARLQHEGPTMWWLWPCGQRPIVPRPCPTADAAPADGEADVSLPRTPGGGLDQALLDEARAWLTGMYTDSKAYKILAPLTERFAELCAAPPVEPAPGAIHPLALAYLEAWVDGTDNDRLYAAVDAWRRIGCPIYVTAAPPAGPEGQTEESLRIIRESLAGPEPGSNVDAERIQSDQARKDYAAAKLMGEPAAAPSGRTVDRVARDQVMALAIAVRELASEVFNDDKSYRDTFRSRLAATIADLAADPATPSSAPQSSAKSDLSARRPPGEGETR